MDIFGLAEAIKKGEFEDGEYTLADLDSAEELSCAYALIRHPGPADNDDECTDCRTMTILDGQMRCMRAGCIYTAHAELSRSCAEMPHPCKDRNGIHDDPLCLGPPEILKARYNNLLKSISVMEAEQKADGISEGKLKFMQWQYQRLLRAKERTLEDIGEYTLQEKLNGFIDPKF